MKAFGQADHSVSSQGRGRKKYYRMTHSIGRLLMEGMTIFLENTQKRNINSDY